MTKMIRSKAVCSLLLAASCALLAACGGGGGGGGSSPPPGSSTPPPPPPPPPASTVAVEITVIDTLGRFVADATASSGAANATTDPNGGTTLNLAPGAVHVVAFSKPGYAEQFRVIDLSGAQPPTKLDAMLIERQPAQQIANIENGGEARGLHGVKVTFPSGALVTSTGQPVTGTIDMLMTPVDVSVDIGAFPGEFAGVAAGAAPLPIVSYGTAEFVPQQNGAKLALAAGQSAQIELPLYVTTHQDGTAIVPGDEIPLWSLPPATGIWVQEGTGTVVSSMASPTGLAMRATITHFSWWNVDAFADMGTVTLNVVAPDDVNIPATSFIDITGVIVGGEGPQSRTSDSIPAGTPRELYVPSGSSTRIDARVDVGDQTCYGTVTVSPPQDGNVDVTLTLSCVTLPTARMVRPADQTVTNSERDLDFQIAVDGPVPDTVELLVDGTSVTTFPPQFFYRGFWDSSVVGEGAHELMPRVTLGGVSRLGEPVSVRVDRTGPIATTIVPAADVEVDRDTQFSVTFSEPVVAAPFSVNDVVSLAVVPLGQTAPVPIDFTASLDATSRVLTVRATEDLPLGEASLSFGGFRDPAGNVVEDTVAATWTVARAARLGGDIPIESASFIRLATNGAGVAHVLHHVEPDGNLQLLRHDGSNFAPLGPVINDRVIAANFTSSDHASLAIAPDGTIYVAFEQTVEGGNNFEVLVKRLDTATGTWVPLGAPFAINRASTSRPKIAVSSDNRPVLTFITGVTHILQAHRFSNGAWTSLGDIDSPAFLSHSVSIDGDGNPAVAYLRGAFGSNASVVQVALHDGIAWNVLAPLDSSGSPNAIGTPFIAHAPDNVPWVSWSNLAEVRLARFDGSVFAAVPMDTPLVTYAGQSALTFLGPDLIVAGAGEYRAARIDVRRLRNGVWDPPAIVTAIGISHHVTMTPSGDTVLVGGTVSADVARIAVLQFP